MNIKDYKITARKKVNLQSIMTSIPTKGLTKDKVKQKLSENIGEIAELQSKLWAQDKYAVLVIFQAMDTAGKDGMIKNVMSGLNPQGTHVHSFTQPTKEELDHDYLWRASKSLPERGQIGIFNRSYYEDVLVVKVHNLLPTTKLPVKFITDKIWMQRYKQIREYETYLCDNGTKVIKFFLHISKEEQRKRLISRIDDDSKNWKFSAGDVEERKYWDEYQICYQEAIGATAMDHAPWYIIPSDKKWLAHLLVSQIVIAELKALKLKYPTLDEKQKKVLENCRSILVKDK